jgi:hypothetical protein
MKIKQVGKGFFLGLLAAVFLTGTAVGAPVTWTYNDDVANWPGYPIVAANYPDDFYGTPVLSTLSVTQNNGYLTSVSLGLTGRFASTAQPEWLFINNNGSPLWDFAVLDTAQDNNSGATFYSVADTFTYTYAIDGRIGHPNGLATGITPINGYLTSVVWSITNANDPNIITDDVGVLTYNFADNMIYIGADQYGGWNIGWSPFCANDVGLTHVPEPSLILLIGCGLLGLGIFKRKIR